MSNYVPWYGKKRVHLAQRKDDLLRLLQKGGSEEKLFQAAEEVRLAMIRALRARRAQILPNGQYEPSLREIDDEIERCSSLSVEMIIAEFRAKVRRGR